MSRETKKCTVASHFQEVDGEGYVCQIEKHGDVYKTKLRSKLFNLKRHIERHHCDIFKSIVEEEQPKKQSSCSKRQYKQATDAFKILSRVKKLLCQ